MKREQKDRNIGKNKGITTDQPGLVRNVLLLQSFTKTSCEDFCSILRKKEDREKTKREKEEGREEKVRERRREEVWVLPASHTGSIPPQKSLPWTKGTVALWCQVNHSPELLSIKNLSSTFQSSISIPSSSSEV